MTGEAVVSPKKRKKEEEEALTCSLQIGSFTAFLYLVEKLRRTVEIAVFLLLRHLRD